MAKRGKSSRALTKTQLRAKYANDRRAGRILQKKGLLSDRANLSRAKPSLAVRKKIDSLRGIITGTQQAIELPDWQRARYKNAGKRTIGKYTIFSKKPQETIKRRGPDILITSKEYTGAFETIIPPIHVETITEYVAWIDDDPERAQNTLPPGTAFAFTFFGNNSRQIFYQAGPSSQEGTLAEYLLHYPIEEEKAWENLVIIRVVNPASWRGGRQDFKRRSSGSNRNRPKNIDKKSEYNRRYYETHRKELKERNRKYYKSMKAKK